LSERVRSTGVAEAVGVLVGVGDGVGDRSVGVAVSSGVGVGEGDGVARGSSLVQARARVVMAARVRSGSFIAHQTFGGGVGFPPREPGVAFG
jgi:hypothetical protein